MTNHYSLKPGDTTSSMRTPPKPGPYYVRFASSGKRYHRESQTEANGMNTTLIFENLSAPAAKLWWKIVNNNNTDTNLSILRSKELTQSQRNAMSKTVKELTKVKLIKKIKREYYLINPDAVIPSEDFKNPTTSNYLTVKTRWNNIP